MNYIKTGLLLAVLSVLFVLIGGYFGGQIGAGYAFVFALIMNTAAYWFSDKIILSMYKAQEVKEEEAPELYNVVRELAATARLPMPKVYITAQTAPNAFATGRDPKHAAVCVTQGIMNILNKEELKGVIAHEISHIKNRDTLIMTVTATIAGAITMIANWARWAAIFGGGRGGRGRDRNMLGYLFMAILAPLAAMLIQMAISRSREFAADKRGAYIAGSPAGLANALIKLDQASKIHTVQATCATAHLFIVNPLRGHDLANLFSTHPPIQKRVEILKQMVIQG